MTRVDRALEEPVESDASVSHASWMYDDRFDILRAGDRS
jgi:hypothetical protein